ncbi:helix-turn-helix domain-containing protein [Streptomyces sp. NPDC050504]|uniref:helix-turn-helix domain-containing protein n=1 Tax=Streptomyces sp. NPDC050504 TaxID=3365618 RepID=UPI0037AED34F
MALQQPSAPPRTRTPSGVIHANTRHATRYTVIGNHLAQHRELSLLAIGLAAHIQSLPAGSPIGIKFLAARFPESEHRIAAALRELERYGYLSRTRERLPGGRVVTRTVSYNQPGAPAKAPAPAPAPEPEPVREPPPPPAPERPTPEHSTATALLADLRRHEPRLTLAERDVHRLGPAVAQWLDRGATPEAVRRTLTASLPDDLRHPAGLLAHRLTTLLPPRLPTPPGPPPPLQNCEGCDRAFRSPTPGHCATCRPAGRPDLKDAA